MVRSRDAVAGVEEVSAAASATTWSGSWGSSASPGGNTHGHEGRTHPPTHQVLPAYCAASSRPVPPALNTASLTSCTHHSLSYLLHSAQPVVTSPALNTAYQYLINPTQPVNTSPTEHSLSTPRPFNTACQRLAHSTQPVSTSPTQHSLSTPHPQRLNGPRKTPRSPQLLPSFVKTGVEGWLIGICHHRP